MERGEDGVGEARREDTLRSPARGLGRSEGGTEGAQVLGGGFGFMHRCISTLGLFVCLLVFVLKSSSLYYK